MQQEYWGYHLLLDCAECDADAIKSYDTIYKFIKQLVEDIDMVAFGEPHIINFGSGNKAGYTLVQLIETSNICAHFVNEYNHMYLDVFSCKDFAPVIVISLVEQYFKAQHINSKFIKRQATQFKN